jgi:hypothetical protein
LPAHKQSLTITLIVAVVTSGLNGHVMRTEMVAGPGTKV